MAKLENEIVYNLIPGDNPETPEETPVSNTEAVSHQPEPVYADTSHRLEKLPEGVIPRYTPKECVPENIDSKTTSQDHTANIALPRGTYDSELMVLRALRERDKMKSMMDRHERHMSEILASVRVLTAERDETRMHYLQAQSILKRLETERDKARSDLHQMNTERDSLRERLKISQETAISERAHLQNAILTLEQERAEQKSRQAEMREAMMGLEAQVNTLERNLHATESELSCLKNECSMLRISNTQTENTLSETQKRLVNRIEDLQRVQTMNKHLDDSNDSLVKELTVLKEELNMLQNTVSKLNQHRDTLHEQLERKNDLLCSTNKELDDKENSIHNMKRQTEDLEASIQLTKEAVSRRDRELAVMRRKLLDLEDELNAVLTLKNATLRDNTQLRDELDRVRLDNKALQFKVDEAAHEIEALGRQMQNYKSDISSIEDLLSSKERECKELQGCQVELRASDSENRRLKERVENLESSLQEAVSAEESSSAELLQLKSTLEKKEEELQHVQSEQLHTVQDLEKARDLSVKLDTEKEVVQQELQGCQVELSASDLENCRLKERVESLESGLQEAVIAEECYSAELLQLKSTLEKKEEELQQVQSEQLHTLKDLEKARVLCFNLDNEKEEVQQELEGCQVELRASGSENCRLKERVESLESSLQEAVSAEECYSAELLQLKSTLEKREEELQQVQSEQLHTVQDLEKARDLCVKLDTEKEEVQQELEGCQVELRASGSENCRLKERVESLESNLQEAVSAEESSSAELLQLKSTLEKKEEELQHMQSEQLHTVQDLEKARILSVKQDTEKEAVQQELESCRSELNLLRRQLGVEREKVLHQQIISQEKLIEIQILTDKLSAAESKANAQSREMEQLRTRSTLLEADLEATQRHLSSERAMKEKVSRRERDLDVMRGELLELEEQLNAVVKLKDTTLRDNTQLRDELDRVRLDNKALQFKLNKAAYEIEAFGRKIQNYESDISSIEDLLSSKKRECRELQVCQVELRASDSENSRLRERVENLESSLQELRSTLEKQEKELQHVQSKHFHTHQDLEKVRDLCVKLHTEKEAVQQELVSCRSELNLLRRQLGVEREKVLHRQISSQEKLIEIQILRDKLLDAERKANAQSREMAQLRTRSTLLEADLEATQRHLSSERERTMIEMCRLGLPSSFCSPILSSTMCTPPSPIGHSLSPHTSSSPEHSPDDTSDHLPERHSPDRNMTYRDIYD